MELISRRWPREVPAHTRTHTHTTCVNTHNVMLAIGRVAEAAWATDGVCDFGH